MIRQPIAWRWQIGLGVAAFVLLAVGYTILSYRQHLINPKDRMIPSWVQLGEALARVVTPDPQSKEIWLWVDTWATGWRVLSGLGLAILIAVPLGIIMACYTPLGAALNPPLSFLAKVPPTAMLAVFFVMAGTGYEMFVTMIMFGVLPALAQTVYHAAKEDVPEELIHKAYTLGASALECIWEVIFKYILPKTLDAVRLQVGPAMVYLIAAEMLVGDVGFGYRIKLQGWRMQDMAPVYVYLVILGLAGLGFDYSLIWLRRWLCPWYGR